MTKQTAVLMRILIASTALGLLAGCGDDLDRAGAAGLIASTPVPDDIHHDLGRETFFCLREHGYVAANIMGGSLTSEGQKFFRSLEFSSFRGESGLTFAQPMTLKDIEITGVVNATAEGSDPPKRIEFLASYPFSGIPEDSPAYQCLLKTPQPIKGTVVAQKYDDGWRITGWDILQFKGIAM